MMRNTRPTLLGLPDGRWAMPGSNFATKPAYFKNPSFKKWVKSGMVVPAVDDAAPIPLPPHISKASPKDAAPAPAPKSEVEAAPSPPVRAPKPATKPTKAVATPVGKWSAADLENISKMQEEDLVAFYGKLMAAHDEADQVAISAVHARAKALTSGS